MVNNFERFLKMIWTQELLTSIDRLGEKESWVELLAVDEACSRLSDSLENEKNCVWKANGGLGRGEAGEPVSISLNSSFRYTSSWYTLWLVNFDSLHQHFRNQFDSHAELTRSTKERGQLCRRVS